MSKIMKDLYDIIKESLLDDENDIINKTTDSIYNDILNGIDFKVGKDGKTIVYSPEPEYGLGKSYNDRRINFYSQIQKNLYKNLTTLSSAKMKFQPLSILNIDVNFSQYNSNHIISNFPVDKVVSLDIENHDDRVVDLDFSNTNFDVVFDIHIQNYSPKTQYNIKAYTKHIPVVIFSDNRESKSFNPDNVKDWNCDTLVIDCSYFRTDRSFSHGEGLMYGFEIDKIQTLIDSNPKAKTILLWDKALNKYWKVNTKTSKRRFDKLVNKKFEIIRDRYFASQETVIGWEFKNRDLFE